MVSNVCMSAILSFKMEYIVAWLFPETLSIDNLKFSIYYILLPVVYTVEFQKRGLPHSHIVLWLADGISYLKAELTFTVAALCYYVQHINVCYMWACRYSMLYFNMLHMFIVVKIVATPMYKC